MFDDWLRGVKDRLLMPLARTIGRTVHPNLISWLALVVGLAAAGLAARGAWGAALVGWLLNRFLDGLDGSTARASGQQSDLGGYLDILVDFVVYAAVPIGIVAGLGTTAAWQAGTVLLASFYLNAASWMYLAAILERRGRGPDHRTTITMPPGLVAGTETVLFYAAFLVVPAYAPRLFLVMAALVTLTVIQRFVWARRHL